MGGEERQHGTSLNGQLLAWTHSVTTTFAPSFANSRAALRPMPYVIWQLVHAQTRHVATYLPSTYICNA